MATQAAGMHNTDGVNIDLYIPRKWCAAPSLRETLPPLVLRPDVASAPCTRSSATNRLIHAKDKSSVQLNIGHVSGACHSQMLPGARSAGREQRRRIRCCCGGCALWLSRRDAAHSLCLLRVGRPAPPFPAHDEPGPSALTLECQPLAADGVYTGEYTMLALCGFIRQQGEGDGSLDRIFTKRLEEAKRQQIDI